MSARHLAGRASAILLLGGAFFLLGCNRAPAPPADPKPPEVVVGRPILREVTEHEEFTGRTEAVMSVDVRARVTGYLEKALFKEGTDVKKGDLLFEIDRRTYQADLDRTQAQVRQGEATLERIGTDYQRARVLVPSRAISREELDKITGSRSEAEASVAGSRAAMRMAKLNLDFTKITAPLSGRISRRLCDPGNLVKADETVMTSIVQLDPIHAYFDIDERTVLRLRRLVQQGKLRSSRDSTIPVQLGLADEDGFSLRGVIDFVDNKLDAGTGTLRVRVVIGNEKLLLSPGMFVRLRLPVSLPSRSALVPEEALASDQGQKFLYVLNEKDEVVYRQVRTGQLFDGLRVISKGLAPGERVILSGQQRVRPGGRVTPRQVESPARVARPPASNPPAL